MRDMERVSIRNKLFRILDITPRLKEIMLSPSLIDVKRKKIRDFLDDMRAAIFYDNPEIQSLEWILARDSIRVLTSILSTRSEELAGHSFLKYLDDLLNKESIRDIEKPNSGFFAELEHLLKGIAGKTGVYSDKPPAFLKYEGTRAARLRSLDLSKMGRKAQRFMARYPCGLDGKTIRKRSANKLRILKYFGATELEWEDWKWHTRHIIRNVKTLSSLIKLTDEEYEAVKLAREYKIPFGITPYYLSLMDYDPGRENDYAVRAQVIPTLHYVTTVI